MAQEKGNGLRSFLQQELSRQEVEELAQASGFSQRLRKIEPYAFVLCLLSTLHYAFHAPFAEFQRQLESFCLLELSRSSLLERFNARCLRMLQALLQKRMSTSLDSQPALGGLCSGFADIVALDATTLGLQSRLPERWPSTTAGKASLKLVTMIRATTHELLGMETMAGKDSESGRQLFTSLARGSVVLADMGFWSASFYLQMQRAGLHFVARLRSDLRPTVLKGLRQHRGRAKKVEQLPLDEVVRGMKRKIIELQCLFECSDQNDSICLRVVGIYNPQEKGYHFYVTDLPPRRLKAELVPLLYRLRWQVELSYRLGKRQLGMDLRRLSNPTRVLCLVMASLLRSSLVASAKRKADETLETSRWNNPEAFALHFLPRFRDAVRDLLLHNIDSTFCLKTIAKHARDPNKTRPPLRWAVTQDGLDLMRFSYASSS